jgi:hypothetical protein
VPDKKFLGLGFTFTANDKGLQKKLQSISTLVSDISDGLSDVNGQFAKMSGPKNVTVKKKTIASRSKSVGMNCCADLIKIGDSQYAALGQIQSTLYKMHSTLRTKSFGSGGKSPVPYMRLVKPIQPKSKNVSGIFEDIEDSISNSSKDFIAEMTKSGFLGPKGIESFTKNISALSITLDEAGNFTKSTQRQLKELFIAATNADKSLFKITKHFYALKAVFDPIVDYLGEIKSSGETFLKSLGIDIRSMVPEQFKAAFGLIKTIITGPFKLFSKIFGLKKKSDETKRLDKLIKFTNTLNVNGKKTTASIVQNSKQVKFTSNRIGGPGTKTRNLFTYVRDIYGAIKNKGKTTATGGLMDLLKAGLIGLASGLIGGIGSLLTGAFGLLKGPIKMLADGFMDLLGWVGKNSASLLSLASAAAVAYAVFDGFKDVIDYSKMNEEQEAAWRKKLAQPTTFKDVFSHPIDSLTKSLEKVSLDIGDTLSSVLVNDKIVKQNKDLLQDMQKQIDVGRSAIDKRKLELGIPIENKQQLRQLKENSELQKQTNANLTQLIELIAAQKPNSVPPQIRANIDGRRMGLYFEQLSNEAEGTARTG